MAEEQDGRAQAKDDAIFYIRGVCRYHVLDDSDCPQWAWEVVVLMVLGPWLHLTVDSKDVVVVRHPTRLPLSLHPGWGFPVPLFEGSLWRP